MSAFLEKYGRHLTYSEFERAVYIETGVALPEPALAGNAPTRQEIETVVTTAKAKARLKPTTDGVCDSLIEVINKLVAVVPTESVSLTNLSAVMKTFDEFRREVGQFKEEAEFIFNDEDVKKTMKWPERFPLLFPEPKKPDDPRSRSEANERSKYFTEAGKLRYDAFEALKAFFGFVTPRVDFVGNLPDAPVPEAPALKPAEPQLVLPLTPEPIPAAPPLTPIPVTA